MLNLLNIESSITNCIDRVSSLERNGFDKIFKTIDSVKKEIGILKKCLNNLEKVLPNNDDEVKKKREEQLRCKEILTSLFKKKSELYKEKDSYKLYGNNNNNCLILYNYFTYLIAKIIHYLLIILPTGIISFIGHVAQFCLGLCTSTIFFREIISVFACLVYWSLLYKAKFIKKFQFNHRHQHQQQSQRH
jgi:hypothetical protein